MKHILLVDDDSAVMRVLVEALRDDHLTVARDGKEASPWPPVPNVRTCSSRIT